MKLFCVLVLVLPSKPALGQASAFDDSTIMAVQLFLNNANQDIARITKTKERLVKKQDELVEQVLALHTDDELNPYDRFRLKDALTEGEDVSKQISKLDYLLAAYDSTNRSRLRVLNEMMQVELLRTTRTAITAEAVTRDSLAELILRMLAERSRWLISVSERNFQFADIRIRTSDNSDLALRKADVLLDQADKLRHYLEDLQDDLYRLRRAKELQNRLTLLARLSKTFGSAWQPETFPSRRLPLTKAIFSESEDLVTIESKIDLEAEAAVARAQLYEKTAVELVTIAERLGL